MSARLTCPAEVGRLATFVLMLALTFVLSPEERGKRLPLL